MTTEAVQQCQYDIAKLITGRMECRDLVLRLRPDDKASLNSLESMYDSDYKPDHAVDFLSKWRKSYPDQTGPGAGRELFRALRAIGRMDIASMFKEFLQPDQDESGTLQSDVMSEQTARPQMTVQTLDSPVSVLYGRSHSTILHDKVTDLQRRTRIAVVRTEGLPSPANGYHSDGASYPLVNLEMSLPTSLEAQVLEYRCRERELEEKNKRLQEKVDLYRELQHENCMLQHEKMEQLRRLEKRSAEKEGQLRQKEEDCERYLAKKDEEVKQLKLCLERQLRDEKRAAEETQQQMRKEFLREKATLEDKVEMLEAEKKLCELKIDELVEKNTRLEETLSELKRNMSTQEKANQKRFEKVENENATLKARMDNLEAALSQSTVCSSGTPSTTIHALQETAKDQLGVRGAAVSQATVDEASLAESQGALEEDNRVSRQADSDVQVERVVDVKLRTVRCFTRKVEQSAILHIIPNRQECGDCFPEEISHLHEVFSVLEGKAKQLSPNTSFIGSKRRSQSTGGNESVASACTRMNEMLFALEHSSTSLLADIERTARLGIDHKIAPSPSANSDIADGEDPVLTLIDELGKSTDTAHLSKALKSCWQLQKFLKSK